MKNYLSIIYFSLLSVSSPLLAQHSVTFRATDSLVVTADLYLANNQYPYVVLLHQDGYSRGEYRDIAPKIMKMGYNCLAVDLRAGNEANYVRNETALRAKKKGYSTELIECMKDIHGAMAYVAEYSDKKMILFGSSFSASLSLYLATGNPKISSVVAFSPGNYFSDSLSIKKTIKDLKKPVFIAASREEYKYVNEFTEPISDAHLTFFYPGKGQGDHGAKALWNKSDSFNDYWLNLMMFMNRIKARK